MKVPAVMLIGLCLAGTASANTIPDWMWAQPLPDMPRIAIEDVQSKLKELGCYRAPVDGVAGRGTTDGIRGWQRVNNAPVNGILSDPFLKALLSGASQPCR
jgi:peptidoglycan hydrolase-like protein with peptidoglycan-binding domain